MKRIVLLFTLILFCKPIFSQEKPIKNLIAFQANVFLDKDLYYGHYIQPVWALRYGYNINNNFSFGPEISGTRIFLRANNIQDTKMVTLNIGGFARYSILSDKRISPFAELSMYYYRYHFVPPSDPGYQNLSERTVNELRGYIAPGVSIKSKSRKFSFDLMYKFSPDRFVNSKKSVISYRLSFNF